MPLMSPEEYKKSLNDGRVVYYRGERVEDVAAHPVIGIAVDHAAIDYEMAEDENDKELALVEGPDGPYSRYYHIPESADDLLKRSVLDRARHGPGRHARGAHQGDRNRRALRPAPARLLHGQEYGHQLSGARPEIPRSLPR